MHKIETLSTPAFLVDRARVRRNADRMREKAVRSGVFFRPHVKTHKTIEGALLQHGGAAGPITVSTMAEAEFFAGHGFRDITYAVPIAPEKLGRAAELASRIGRLTLLVDSPVALQAIAARHRAEGTTFDVMLKVDCGYHRAGVEPSNPDGIALALALATSPAVRFGGFLTHAGHSYDAKGIDDVRIVAAAETAAVTQFREILAAEGFPELVRSVGSTPTCSVVETFADCEEVRPGNYVFYDRFQASIGSCGAEDVAVSVLATVVGSYPERKAAVLDAGALALSKDRGPEHVEQRVQYGVVCDLALRPLAGIGLAALSQEHGKIVGDASSIAALPVGTKVRIVPNHSCLTAALFERYAVIDGEEVVDEWRPCRGW